MYFGWILLMCLELLQKAVALRFEILQRGISIISSEFPGAIPVFSCRQGYIPVNRPKREGVLVADVA